MAKRPVSEKTKEIKRLMMEQFQACVSHDIKRVRAIHNEIESLLNKIEDDKNGTA